MIFLFCYRHLPGLICLVGPLCRLLSVKYTTWPGVTGFEPPTVELFGGDALFMIGFWHAAFQIYSTTAHCVSNKLTTTPLGAPSLDTNALKL